MTQQSMYSMPNSTAREADALPNLFVIGTPKAGTSALVAALGTHPDIFVPEVKELRYFDAAIYYDSPGDYPIRTVDEYLNFFRCPEARSAAFRVDGSVYCMYSADSIRNILRLSPKARFLIMLRDPVAAAQSMHAQRLKYSRPAMREISDDFCTCWRALPLRRNGAGFPKGCSNRFLFRYDLLYSYEQSLPAILQLIPRGQVILERYERFRESPEDVFKRLFEFINVTPHSIREPKTVNPSFHAKPTLVASILGNVARRTYHVRKALGLQGNRVAAIRQLMHTPETPRPDKRPPCEDEVTAFFERTYKYLEHLEADGLLPPVPTSM